MTTKVKITKVGNSSAVILPKEIMETMNFAQGDELNIKVNHDGVQLSPYDAMKSKQLELARNIMRENRNMLKKLAE